MSKVLVTARIPEQGLNELRQQHQVVYPDQEVMPREDVLRAIADCDALLAVSVKVDAELLSAAPRLKVVVNFGAGYDNVAVPEATSRGILVATIPDAVTEATAELAFGLMLSVMRRIAEGDRKLRTEAGEWGILKNLGTSLYGKTLGILGMGRIGKALARRARAFGMNLVYHNRKRLSGEESSFNARYLELAELLATADVLSIHVPFSPATKHLIGREQLALMKPSAYLINTARGPLVDEGALVEALAQRRLAGAGLDVFEREPVIPAALLAMDQVVLTPHIGSATAETRLAMTRAAARSLLDFFGGRIVDSPLNPEVLRPR